MHSPAGASSFDSRSANKTKAEKFMTNYNENLALSALKEAREAVEAELERIYPVSRSRNKR